MIAVKNRYNKNLTRLYPDSKLPRLGVLASNTYRLRKSEYFNRALYVMVSGAHSSILPDGWLILRLDFVVLNVGPIPTRA
jgi:hypothetical protein